jgi:hypothetical protein
MKIGDRTRTHGMSKTPEYRIWGGIINRCENQNDENQYRKYGARGISMCAEWRADFMAFYRDMGPRPSPAHSIDRKDSNGNYEPSNCRWSTLDVQANNRGDNRVVTYRVTEMTLTQAMRASGSQFKLPTIRWRLDKMGWDLERALTAPDRRRTAQLKRENRAA